MSKPAMFKSLAVALVVIVGWFVIATGILYRVGSERLEAQCPGWSAHEQGPSKPPDQSFYSGMTMMSLASSSPLYRKAALDQAAWDSYRCAVATLRTINETYPMSEDVKAGWETSREWLIEHRDDLNQLWIDNHVVFHLEDEGFRGAWGPAPDPQPARN